MFNFLYDFIMLYIVTTKRHWKSFFIALQHFLDN